MDAGKYLGDAGFWLAWVGVDIAADIFKEVVYDYDTKVRAMAAEAAEDDEAGR